jgi:hypothetical protein
MVNLYRHQFYRHRCLEFLQSTFAVDARRAPGGRKKQDLLFLPCSCHPLTKMNSEAATATATAKITGNLNQFSANECWTMV